MSSARLKTANLSGSQPPTTQDRRSGDGHAGLHLLLEPAAQQQEERGEEAHHRMTMVRLPLTAFVVVVVRQRLSPGGRVNCWPTEPGL